MRLPDSDGVEFDSARFVIDQSGGHWVRRGVGAAPECGSAFRVFNAAGIHLLSPSDLRCDGCAAAWAAFLLAHEAAP